MSTILKSLVSSPLQKVRSRGLITDPVYGLGLGFEFGSPNHDFPLKYTVTKLHHYACKHFRGNRREDELSMLV